MTTPQEHGGPRAGVLHEATGAQPLVRRVADFNARVHAVQAGSRWHPLGPDPDSFAADLTVLVCPGAELVVGLTEGARVHVPAREGPPRVALGVHRGGDHLLLGRGDAVSVPPGHLTVLRSDEAVTWARPGRSQVATLLVDTALLGASAVLLERHPGGPVPLPEGMEGLLLRPLDHQHRAWDAAGGTRYLVGVAELVLATVLESVGDGGTSAVRRRQVEDFIDVHLAEPDLGPDSIAAALFLSRRRLYQLLDGEEGVAERVRRLRLQRACELLAAPGLAGLPVAEVGRRCGFASAAHFAKVFRAGVGDTPSGYRARARA